MGLACCSIPRPSPCRLLCPYPQSFDALRRTERRLQWRNYFLGEHLHLLDMRVLWAIGTHDKLGGAGGDIILDLLSHLIGGTQGGVIRWRDVLSPANGSAGSPQSFFAVVCENIRNQDSVVILGNLPADLCGVIADRFDARRDFAGCHRRNQPAVREPPRASKGSFTSATNPERWASLLIRTRQESQVFDRTKLSLKVHIY